MAQYLFSLFLAAFQGICRNRGGPYSPGTHTVAFLLPCRHIQVLQVSTGLTSSPGPMRFMKRGARVIVYLRLAGQDKFNISV